MNTAYFGSLDRIGSTGKIPLEAGSKAFRATLSGVGSVSATVQVWGDAVLLGTLNLSGTDGDAGVIRSAATYETYYFNVTAISGGSASVNFKVEALESTVVDIRNYGAVGDGITDDSAAIQAAIADAGEESGEVFFPPGVFNLGTGINIAGNAVRLRGSGRHITKLRHTPTVDGQVAVDFDMGGASGYYWDVRDLTIDTQDESYNKTALRFADARELNVDNIFINGFGGAGTDSVGIQFLGREIVNLTNSEIIANVPIRLSGNPNNGTLDVDTFSFQNIYLISDNTTDTLTRASILVDGDVIFKSLVISGANSFAKGDYGFYYVTSELVGTSQRFITLSGINTEQLNTRSIHIDTTQGSNNRDLRLLTVESCLLDELVPGLYLRGVENVHLKDSHLAQGSGVSLIDVTGLSGSTYGMVWSNVWTQSTPGTIDVASMTLNASYTASGRTHPHSAFWSR